MKLFEGNLFSIDVKENDDDNYQVLEYFDLKNDREIKNMKKILLTLTLLICLVGCDSENPGGVLTNNQIPKSVFEFIDEKNILDGEYIIAYYDVTITLNNSESAILTNKNVIYYKGGRVIKIPINKIKNIDNEKDFFGFYIYITPKYGPLMTIEIATMNGGELFLDLLKTETEKI